MTHICVSKQTSIGSDNGLSPGRRQAIIWTNARLLLIGPLGTNFSEVLIEIITFSFKKMRLKVSSANWRPFCLGLNELMVYVLNWFWLNNMFLFYIIPWHRWYGLFKTFLVEDKGMFTMHNQYHCCWWSGDVCQQAINSFGHDLGLSELSGLSTKGVK